MSIPSGKKKEYLEVNQLLICMVLTVSALEVHKNHDGLETQKKVLEQVLL